LRPTARPGAGERRALGDGSAAALAATGPLDLRHHAGVRIEELLLDLRPAADVLDREELRPRREVEALGRARDDRPVAVLREDLLSRGGVEELHESVRLGLVLRRRRDGDRILDEDR